MVSEHMVKLGMNRNIMREIFEHGKRRAKVVGAGNVLDFSLGNPSVPPPAKVNDTIRAVLDGRCTTVSTPIPAPLATRAAGRDRRLADPPLRGVLHGGRAVSDRGRRRRPVLLPVRPAYAGG